MLYHLTKNFLFRKLVTLLMSTYWKEAINNIKIDLRSRNDALSFDKISFLGN